VPAFDFLYESLKRKRIPSPAVAETIIGLFKTEVIHHAGPWRGLEDVEYATLAWVSWYNTARLLEPLGYVPPAEYEAQYHTASSDSPSWYSSNPVSGKAGAIHCLYLDKRSATCETCFMTS
jgi:hypothetical protein